MSIPNDTRILELTLKQVYERINLAVEESFSKKAIASLRQCLPPNYTQSFAYQIPKAVSKTYTIEEQLLKLKETFKGTFLDGHFCLCDNALYFRYDTGDLTAKYNEEQFRDMREMFENAGYDVVDSLCEHDCITCTLIDKNATQQTE